MDAAQALSLVLERIRAGGLDYPVADLTVDRFWGGWCVFAPEMVADGDPEDEPVVRSVFLVGESGRVEVVSSYDPAEDARAQFEEACLWFGAAESGAEESGPSHPDFGRFARPRGPRTATDYDRQAIEAFARALVRERDFAGWLSGRLRELGDLVGGAGRLVARLPDTEAAQHLMEFVEPDDEEDGGGRFPTAVWRTWPPVDPASLPDVDTAGWLLVLAEVASDYLERVAAESDAAGRLAETIAERAQEAPLWRACGVAEVFPPIVAIRRDGQVAADVEALRRFVAEDGPDDFLDELLMTPSSDDPDGQALLRIAIDAAERPRHVVDLDVAGTAAFRRVLERLGMGFENDWYGPVFAAPDPESDRFDGWSERDRSAGAVVTEPEDAIASVVEWIRARGLDYPTEGLVADRFAVGWAVYAPVEVDESDPMAFLDMPVGRSVFLVGDSGRIKETSSSVPPQQAEAEFIAAERAADGMIDLEWAAMQLKEEGEIQDFTIVDAPPEEAIAAEASGLIEPIVQQLALFGPPGWRRFGAVFAVTVSAERCRVRFWTDRPGDVVPVPEPVMELVRRQREVAARMSAGPWWRLLLNVTHLGETTVSYDYGDRPLPEEDLLAPEHYRDDLAAFPRAEVPAWLAEYVAEGSGGTLDVTVDGRRLHVDSREIAYGGRSIALDLVEWVRYQSTHVTTKRFLGMSSSRVVWHFAVGTPATTIELEFPGDGGDAPPPDAWTFLVDLSRRELEPRLVERLAERVRRGEAVEVGGLQVHRGGVVTPAGVLGWSAIGDVRVVGGQVSLYRAVRSESVVSVPLSNANAVLIRPLVAAMTS